MPFSAPLPVPTMIAVGVARPRAHGQAMMSTATAASMASVKLGSGPNASHTAKVTPAMAKTVGTKTLATLSASRWIGALEPCASSTSRMICASAVSLPTLVAVKRKAPVRFTVAPITRSPGPFSTGMDSPVSIDSSIDERPSSTTPSTGTFSPGRTRTTSSTRTSSTGTSSSASPRTTRAVLACRPISFFMACDV